MALFDKMGWALGICLANIFSVLGIRRAVIGGGVSSAWDLFISSLEKTLAQNSSMLDPGAALILRSRLGNRRGPDRSGASQPQMHASEHVIQGSPLIDSPVRLSTD